MDIYSSLAENRDAIRMPFQPYSNASAVDASRLFIERMMAIITGPPHRNDYQDEIDEMSDASRTEKQDRD